VFGNAQVYKWLSAVQQSEKNDFFLV
jgi:hypothetical protein